MKDRKIIIIEILASGEKESVQPELNFILSCISNTKTLRIIGYSMDTGSVSFGTIALNYEKQE